MLWGNNDGFISKFSAPAAREIISRCTFTIFFCSTLTCPSVPSTDTIIYFSITLYGWFCSFHSRKFFYRWFHINHVPSGSRVLVGIKSVIHERSETSIPKSKTKWKYNLNCIYIPEDDNISDVEEQTAVRGDGGGQKSNIYFSIFWKISIAATGQKFSTFFCPGQFWKLPWAVFLFNLENLN